MRDINTKENINSMSVITIIIDTADIRKPYENGETRNLKCVEVIKDEEEEITLDDCYNIAVENGYINATITILNNTPMGGEVYTYGNHGDFWEKTGSLVGYA